MGNFATESQITQRCRWVEQF